MVINFKKFDKNVKISEKKLKDTVEYNLFSIIENISIEPNENLPVGAGVRIILPVEYEAQIKNESDVELKCGLVILDSPGIIIPNYSGEIKILLYDSFNITKTTYLNTTIVRLVISTK